MRFKKLRELIRELDNLPGVSGFCTGVALALGLFLYVLFTGGIR